MIFRIKSPSPFKTTPAIRLIAAVDQNWGIGREGKLLFRISDDLKRFSALTTGNIVVMGRKTLSTLPGGRPLKDRANIILSRNKGLSVQGAAVVHELAELAKELKRPLYAGKDVYCIGGAEIYALLLPYCTDAYMTHIDAEVSADAYFPRLDTHKDWELAEMGAYMGEPAHAFARYRNKNVRLFAFEL